MDKTPEQLKADKLKKFTDNPDRFVDMDDIIACMIRVNGGVANYIGPAKRSEYNIAKSELQYQIDKILTEMDTAKKSKIINPFRKNKGAFGGNN